MSMPSLPTLVRSSVSRLMSTVPQIPTIIGIPFTLMAMGTANFSQYGYECISGMVGGIFSITRNQRTYLGLGVICLIGTSVSWPLYPMFI